MGAPRMAPEQPLQLGDHGVQTPGTPKANNTGEPGQREAAPRALEAHRAELRSPLRPLPMPGLFRGLLRAGDAGVGRRCVLSCRPGGPLPACPLLLPGAPAVPRGHAAGSVTALPALSLPLHSGGVPRSRKGFPGGTCFSTAGMGSCGWLWGPVGLSQMPWDICAHAPRESWKLRG